MSRVCENCGAVLHGDFCHACGQDSRKRVRGLGAILNDFFDEFLDWDSRLIRTLIPLMARPGHLSNEYIRGRRVRYVPPLRLYLVISVLFFLVLAATGGLGEDNVKLDMGNTPVVGEGAAGEPPKPLEGDLDLPFLAKETQAEFMRQLNRIAAEPELLYRQMRALAPSMMFLMLPVFAFVLKVFYIYKPRYYVEHLILALHTHSFLFMSFMLMIGMKQLKSVLETQPLAPFTSGAMTWLAIALMVWLPVYLYLSQKRFYAQGWFLTTVKYLLTGTTYIVMLSLFSFVLMIASIMTA